MSGFFSKQNFRDSRSQDPEFFGTLITWIENISVNFFTAVIFLGHHPICWTNPSLSQETDWYADTQHQSWDDPQSGVGWLHCRGPGGWHSSPAPAVVCMDIKPGSGEEAVTIRNQEEYIDRSLRGPGRHVHQGRLDVELPRSDAEFVRHTFQGPYV